MFGLDWVGVIAGIGIVLILGGAGVMATVTRSQVRRGSFRAAARDAAIAAHEERLPS